MKESTIAKGRIGVYVPDHPGANNRGYVLRARYVMEQYIGRYLTSDEEVHHKDFDKTNDVIENLRLMTKAEHCALHASLQRKLDYDLISDLIDEGNGYKRIAKLTGYNVNAVKSAVRKIKAA